MILQMSNPMGAQVSQQTMMNKQAEMQKFQMEFQQAQQRLMMA